MENTDLSEVCIVVGTRPEIIKMAPVVRAIHDSNELTPYIIHTNQHYDEELSAAFFTDLNLPAPDQNLHVESGTQAEQTANGLTGIEQVLQERSPPIVLAQGDTNAVLSTALAASKLSVQFGHIEAGIRSFDRTMPEEVNRVIADQVSNLAFVPTETAAKNLRNEGVTEGVHVTGNTIVDACSDHLSIAERESTILDSLQLAKQNYIVATIHRPHNTDNADRLEQIFSEFGLIDYPVVFPAHPRTQNRIEELDIAVPDTLNVVEPLDYLDFLKLESNAKVIVTDSGGIQEEASILQVPCLTVRPNTERPETTEAGVNRLVEPEEIGAWIQKLWSSPSLYQSMQNQPDLYGDGTAGRRIAEIIETQF
jgi:UDP-N-acetylglucosamine 2-epimerase (non-hydrolysing)